MFESYTETARRTVFIGVYEAGQFGSQSVEIEHLLLGLLRADLSLSIRLFKSSQKLEEVRGRIERETARGNRAISTWVDLPLSSQSERVLNRAAEEASRLQQPYVAAEHLLLGIVREQTSIAARAIFESGISLAQLEEEARRAKEGTSGGAHISGETLAACDFRDLVAEAGNNQAGPLIGRERELEQIIQILLRRTKNSPVLIGEPGVGKESIVRGLAQRIALGHVPADLAGRQILGMDAPEFAGAFSLSRSTEPAMAALRQKLAEIAQNGGPIIYVRGLFDLRTTMPVLASYLKPGKLQVIATGAPLSLRLALDRGDELARNFEAVNVLPPTEKDAIRIIEGVKEDFESYHGVVLSPEAIQMAVSASGRFLRHRPLPERAIDLVDDACTRIKLRRDGEPPEIREAEIRIRVIVREMERAILNHEFEKARALSEEERERRKIIARLREALTIEKRSNTVSTDDILEVIAARTSLTASAVKAALEQTQVPDQSDAIRIEFASRIPIGRRDWVEGLLSYLADCSVEETDRLLQTIRTAKNQMDRTI